MISLFLCLEVRPFRMKKERIDLNTAMSIDAEGGTLVIRNTGISLYIPPNALEEEADINITVVNDTEIQMPQKRNLPIVTPLVKCEPSGIKFRKPVTLTLPHCGLVTDGKDQTMISFCGTESGRHRSCWDPKYLATTSLKLWMRKFVARCWNPEVLSVSM